MVQTMIQGMVTAGLILGIPGMLAAGEGERVKGGPWAAHVLAAGAYRGSEISQGATQPAPPPANPFGFTAETTAAECASSCHASKLNEWKNGAGTDLPPFNVWDEADENAFQSGNLSDLDPYDTTEAGNMHSMAWRDYEFQLIYHEQPTLLQGMCQRCHIPVAASEAKRRWGVTAPKANSTKAANSGDGISCVGCHLDSRGNILGPESEGGDFAKEEEHPVWGSRAFADGVTLCANCHNDSVFGSFTQTADEFFAQRPRSGEDDFTCVGCHMPATRGGDDDRRSHAFPGGQSAAFREKALRVTLPTTLTAGRELTIDVENVGAGHNVPTGDTFRAFSLQVSVEDPGGTPVLDHEVFITKRSKTPLYTEVVDYDRIEPIGYGERRTVGFGTLPAGSYTLHVDLRYYQIKPTVLAWRSKPQEEVEAYGVSTVKSWDVALDVTP